MGEDKVEAESKLYGIVSDKSFFNSNRVVISSSGYRCKGDEKYPLIFFALTLDFTKPRLNKSPNQINSIRFLIALQQGVTKDGRGGDT